MTDQFIMSTTLRYAICLVVTVGLTGFGWAPVLVSACSERRPTSLRVIWQVGWILAIGLLLQLGIVCLLALGGLVRLPYLLASSMLIAGVGIGCRVRCHRSDIAWVARGQSFLYACGIIVIWAGLVCAMPGRSANMVGGWDPGLYVNFGLKISRTGGMAPLRPEVYQKLDHEGRIYFSRGDDNYREVLPAVPINSERAELMHYFFPLTPLAIAATVEQGGLRSGLRMNLFLAGMVALALLLLVMTVGGSAMFMGGSVLALVGAPVFIYLTQLPTTEMMQCFLIVMACIFLVRLDRPWMPLCLGGVFLLAVLNRVSFLPFGAILVLSMVTVDLVSDVRCCRPRQLVPAGVALIGGWAINMVGFHETMVRLAHIMPVLYLITAVAFLSAFLLARRPPWLQAVLQSRRTVVTARCVAASGLALFGVGLLVYTVNPDFAANPFRMAGKLLPFLGRGLVFTGTVGLFVYVFSRKQPRELSVILIALSVITALTLYKSFIADIFPWASRRYLMYTVPLLALSSGWLLDRLWHSERLKVWGRGLACMVVLIVVLGGLPHSQHAALRSEYRGVPAMVKLIASRIDEHDAVIVDSPQWATPLLLHDGKNILNGKRIWSRRNAAHTAHGMDILKRLAESGMRIRFLTSTSYGLAIYEGLDAHTELDWEYGPFYYRELTHSSHGDDFVAERTSRQFRLYTLHWP